MISLINERTSSSFVDRNSKYLRTPEVLSVSINDRDTYRPALLLWQSPLQFHQRGIPLVEFMSPAVPIDFISHELSLLSVYLGISLINLSFSLPLYILIFIQYYYTRFGIVVKYFLKNEGQQGVQRVAVSSDIYSMCVGDSFRQTEGFKHNDSMFIYTFY